MMGRGSRRLWLPTAALAVFLSVASPLAAPPSASATVAGTLSVAVLSVTVSQSAVNFGTCSGGNSTASKLGFPNGTCYAPVDSNNIISYVTVTNTGAPGHIYVNGGDAVPSDNGTHWTLCTCTPGQDHYSVNTANTQGIGNTYLQNGPVCDIAFDLNDCVAPTNGARHEFVQLEGPSATTDGSNTFTISVTWTAVL